MPLLKGRFWKPLHSKDASKNDEATYKIDHSGEVFHCRDDYEKTLLLYKEPLWTCQCTGRINLTHEEAMESEEETRKDISDKFPEFYKKPVLSVVHHSTETLDALVEKASKTLYENLMVGEPVLLKIKCGEKTLAGTIAKQEPAKNIGHTNGSVSPSSDKENKEALKSPSKSVPPKLSSNFQYNLRLENEDKVISGIPAADLSRTTKVPNKELIRVFIRCFAWRGGYANTSPWVVQPSVAKQFGIQGKLADIFFSPNKNADLARKAFEDALKECRRSRSSSPRKAAQQSPRKSASPSKKMFESPRKNLTSSNKSSPKKSTSSKSSTPKSTPKKSNDESDSDEEISLAELKKRTPVKQAPKSQEKKPRGRPKKSAVDAIKKKAGAGTATESSDDEVVLSKLKGKLSKHADKRKRNKSSSKDAGGKKMKQATLFDMKGRKSDGKSSLKKSDSSSSKHSPKKYTQPPLAIKLQKAMKKDDNQKVVLQLAFKCARELSQKQRQKLPDSIRDLVQEKWLKVEEKNKLAKMTAEERAEYYRKKRKETQKEQKRKKRKIEDTELKNSDLPAPKLVATPDGLPNELFGDVAMVAEFMATYKGLLLPDEELPLNTATLLRALSGGGEGFAYLARIISILLQTLLQDDIASDYKELEVKLSDIGVNEYTCSELLRLCLRSYDHDDVSNASSDVSNVDEDAEQVPQELIEELESTELHDLSTEHKLQLLQCLTHRVMNTYSVQDYMLTMQNQASLLWKEKIKILKEKNDLMKIEKEKKKQELTNIKAKAEASKAKEEAKAENGQVSLKKFYGGGEEKSSAEGGGDEATENADLASVVKRRRILAARAAEQRHVREREERMRRAKETEAQRKERETEQFLNKFNESMLLSKQVQRIQPIGTDRNHNRYWVFSDCTPGLYVEKGWACKDMGYSVHTGAQPDASDSDSSSSEEEAEEHKDGGPPTTKSKKAKVKVDKCKDKTFPNVGQNLWFVYDDIAEVYALQGQLNTQGVREAPLRAEIEKQYDVIKTQLAKQHKTGSELEESKGTDDLIHGFKEELADFDHRIRVGGLGGMADEAVWEKQLETAKTLTDFGQCLKDLQDSILEKFLKGMILKTGKRSKQEPDVKVKEEKELDSDDDSEVPSNTDASKGAKADDTDIKQEVMSPEDADDVVPVGKIQWRAAIDACTSWSRLHVLMGILDSCIKWEKSAENAKCKVCRRKGDEGTVLLCDECNGAFHMYCLRPALFEVPDGDWYCPACKPVEQRRKAREVRYPAESQDTEEGEEELVHEQSCTVCEGTEDLIECSTCVSVFHRDCHEPPVRRTVRSNWRCMQCLSGVRIRKKSRRAAAQKRKRYDDDFVEEWEEGYNETRKAKRAKVDDDVIEDPYGNHYKNDTSKSRAARYAQRNAEYAPSATASEHEDSEEEEEQVEESKPARAAPRRSGGRTRSPRNTWNTSLHNNTTTDDEDTENDDVTPSRSKARKPKAAKPDVDPQEILKINIGQILMRLRRNKHAWPFQDPVDPKVVPDYYDIVKKPMDLLTMKCKFDCEEYTSGESFLRDLAQIFTNCELYNRPDSDVYKCIAPLEKLVRELNHRFLPEVTYPRDEENNGPTIPNGHMDPSPTHIGGRRSSLKIKTSANIAKNTSAGSKSPAVTSPVSSSRSKTSPRLTNNSMSLMDHDYF